ncbi:hypothetical protein [Vibrio mediterranei]|uniref:hypothetical protein n=1 Tax=Vibrio mediterranei TaxID=689 RepID=UPI00406975EF
MSLLPQICGYLNRENQFSVSKGADLSSQLCHAWFISQLPEHPEYQNACLLLTAHESHPVIDCSRYFCTEARAELVSCQNELPQSDNPLWSLFSPEAMECQMSPDSVKARIAKQRTLTDIVVKKQAIVNVAEELLFTSNVLLGLPLSGDDTRHIQLGEVFHQALKTAQNQPQEYWYDHPIPVGISPQENEILYGLQQLDIALEAEVARGNLAKNQKVTLVLSCSVTHPALSSIAREYVEYEVKTHLRLKHLDVAVCAESECQEILRCGFPAASDALKGVFGVNGAYGRHYTFLKAIAPLWQKAINPTLKATFKIDLDQVFDQQKLVDETGKSAFEHFLDSKWGATAVDCEGNKLKLGMIAGGLVNESDAHLGLFTADVKSPTGDDYAMFEQLFCARWGQALSTQEEVIGQREDFQRVHVTGGTNGILIESLYEFQPFTPTFIHRAEDQAFILSALANPVEGYQLAYSHQPGLIMRHDKEAFAGRVMEVSEAGKVLGDIERVLLFSHYAKHHPMGIEQLKDRLYPFTGAFISKTPVALALLRFMLEGCYRNREYLDSGATRLINCLNYCHNSLESELKANQNGWQEYYSQLQQSKLSQQAISAVRRCLLMINES